ncbi:MAG: PD-(D/E)XK motif protein [Ignavibacteriales bacterium]|nr:PD-(D/E)XK motif protein [Ignavibacteriales bacterium]
MEKIKNRFLEIEGINIFSRINPSHFIDLYVGRDDQGRYAIKYRGDFKPEKNIKSVAGIAVNQYRNEDFNTLQFSLTQNDINELFFIFCNDIIEATESITDYRKAYKTILDRYYSWKKMFSATKKLLAESDIMGLVGELLFLRDFLFEKYGKGEALSSWSGQELTHKDFSYEGIWYEVKTISSGKDSVKISSLEQLESINKGELVVFSLEKMSSSYDGIKINGLALEILNSLELDIHKDLFLSAIMSHGFAFDEIYDELVYEFVSMSRYMVDSNFPKLTRNDINDAIIKVQYDLSLTILNNFLI